MPTKQIQTFEPKYPCRHPDHEPPAARVYDPGVYEHTCPGCGRVTVFTVPPRPMALAAKEWGA